MTTSTLTLADFLLARIAEDENAATRIRDEGRVELWFAVDEGERIDVGAFTTARVLAECEAKRLIVRILRRAARHDPADLLVLQFLAIPYRDHPDYRQEWTP